MSGVDKTDIIKSTSGINFRSNVQSTDKFPKSSESQSIIINFYSGNQSQKIDKLVQTEGHLIDSDRTRPKYREILAKRREVSTSPSYETDSENSEDDYRLVSGQKSAPLFFQDRKPEQLMETRKQGNENKPLKGGINVRTTSDLERKKLEAELKAAEEIAKLKESLIEKRLALELVSIQDGTERHQKMALTHPSPPHSELRTLEEMAMKKQALIESNLSQELHSLELQNRLQTPRPIPPPPSGPSRQPSISGKPNFKTESSSSVLNSLRNVSVIDRKFNFDKSLGGHLDVRSPSPSNFFSSFDSRFNDSRNRTEERNLGYPRQEAVYEASKTNAAHSAWKSVVSKIKKKIKTSKSPPDWSNYSDEKQRGR